MIVLNLKESLKLGRIKSRCWPWKPKRLTKSILSEHDIEIPFLDSGISVLAGFNLGIPIDSLSWQFRAFAPVI